MPNTSNLDPRFLEMYLLLLEGQDHNAWTNFTDLCRNERVNPTHVFQHLAFDL